MADELELTPREIAIASGQDPDSVVDAQDEAVVEDAQQDAVAEVEGETAEADQTETTEVTEDTDQQVGPATDGDIGSAKEGAGAWIDDEVRSRATAYGIAEADLNEMKGIEEFQRTTLFFDKQLVGLAAQPEQTQAANEQVQKQVVEAATSGKLQKFDRAKLEAEGYDETTLAIVDQNNALIDAFEAQSQKVATFEQFVAAQQEMQAKIAHRQVIEQFHSTLDGLDPKRFGKSVDGGVVKPLTPAQDEARRKVYEMAETLELGEIQRAKLQGRQPVIPPRQLMIERAYQVVFGAEVQKEKAAQRAQEIAKQSAKRRPAAVARTPNGQFKPKAKPTSISEEAALIAADPAIVKFYAEATHETGSE